MRTLILLLLLVAGACSRSETSSPDNQSAEPPAQEAAALPDPPAAPPPSDEAEQAAEESAPGVDLDASPSVELLDAGKTPRKALRSSFEPGNKEKLQVKSDWVVITGFGPLIQSKSVMPSMVYEVETEVEESTEEGTRFNFRVKKAATKSNGDISPQQLEFVKQAAESVQAIAGSFSINARGMVEAFTMPVPAGATLFVYDMVEQIERAVRLASLPLPEEPVGKGATWTASQLTMRRGARSRQTSTFKLLSAKGERVRAKITYALSTPKQRIRMPHSPNMQPLQLDELDFMGEGKGTWRLSQLAPPSASEETNLGFKMATTTPQPEVALMGIETTIEVKPAR